MIILIHQHQISDIRRYFITPAPRPAPVEKGRGRGRRGVGDWREYTKRIRRDVLFIR